MFCFKRIFRACQIPSQSPRPRMNIIPQSSSLSDIGHEEWVMDYRDLRERRKPAVTAWAHSLFCLRYSWILSKYPKFFWISHRSMIIAAICKPRFPIVLDCRLPRHRARTTVEIFRVARIDICWHPAPENQMKFFLYIFPPSHSNDIKFLLLLQILVEIEK